MTEGANQYITPISIILAGGLIGLGVYFGGGIQTGSKTPTGEAPESTVAFKEVGKDDHILGNPDAAVKVIEYSDFDCPYCRVFHKTMKSIIEEYGKDGDVAWVYRHLPLDQLHPNARKKSEASECVASLGGNAAFWSFADKIFESEGNPDLTLLPAFAKESGVDEAKFNECLNSGRTAELVKEDEADAVKIGARGTPHSIITTGEKSMPVSGAVPLESMKQLIDQALADL